MKWLWRGFFLAATAVLAPAEEVPMAIIVTGAGGTPDYVATFAAWTEKWRAACIGANIVPTVLGGEAAEPSPRRQLQETLSAAPKDGSEALWLVLLGHGTTSGEEGKFNVSGDDLTATELATWLKPFTRPVVLIDSFSASGGWLKPVAAPGRVVITATKSGRENNFSHFGGYLAATIAAPASDLDHDGQTSLLEAWVTAAKQTAAFFRERRPHRHRTHPARRQWRRPRHAR